MTSVVASACTGIISSPNSESALGPDAGNGVITPSSDPNDLVKCDSGEQPGPRLLRLLTRDEYAHSVADILGIPVPDVDNLPVEPRVGGFNNNAAASVVTSRHIDEYIATAEKLVATALTTNRAAFLGCDSALATCTKTFVESFGKKAFRRPLTTEESARYVAMFDPALTGGTFDQGVTLVVSSIFASPSFLYRVEAGDAVGDGTYKLSPFETATALSYLFWGTTPDDELLGAASGGTLGTPAEIEAQARRMLASPKSRPQVAAFFTQWLNTSALLEANKDKQIYPAFTDQVRESLAAEQSAFVNYVVFDGTKKFDELFTADYVFANDALASFYGLGGASLGADVKKVVVATDSNRGGILTLGSVLASHAHSNESSPIKRGLFVRDRLLCQDMPPPPANVNTTPPGLDPTLTTRERFAKHTADPVCKSCHQFLDGVGYGFERFDGVGAYRMTENGLAIDASGELKNRESLDTPSSDAFNGPRELGAILAKSERAQTCIATQYYRFAHGFRESSVDVCAVRSLASTFKTGGTNLQELLVEVAKQKSFALRRETAAGDKQ